MGNLMTSFGTGVSGIQVAQVGLNTAAHNTSNTDAAGYVRQQVIVADHTYITNYDENNGLRQIGIGTHVAVILQRRSQFLDNQYREEMGREKFYDVRANTAMELEDLFGEIDKASFAEDLNDIWCAFQELSKTPDDITSREMLVAEANAFLKKCNTLYNQISQYQTNMNSRITTITNRINEIAEEIHHINSRVVLVEASDQQANDLYDRRNLLLDELSEYVPVHTDTYSNGVVTVTIEGIPLVGLDNFYTMTTEPMEEGNPMLKPVWADNGGGDVFRGTLTFSPAADTDIGSLKGILVTRGSFVGNYTHMPIEPKKEDYTDADDNFDSVSYKIAMNKYEDDVKYYNNMIEPATVTTMEVQLDTLIHGVVTMINDVLCPNKEISVLDGEGNVVKIKVLDEDRAPKGCNGTIGKELFVRGSYDRYYEDTVTLADGTTQTVKIYNEEDPSNIYSLYSLSQIGVNPEIIVDTANLPLLENDNSGFAGGYASSFLQELLDKWDDDILVLDPNSNTFYNFNDYYTGMIGGLGTTGKVALNYVESAETLVGSIEDQRQSLTGVSTDEELVDLVRFQHMYNACSRYITVIDEMLETIITQL